MRTQKKNAGKKNPPPGGPREKTPLLEGSQNFKRGGAMGVNFEPSGGRAWQKSGGKAQGRSLKVALRGLRATTS